MLMLNRIRFGSFLLAPLRGAHAFRQRRSLLLGTLGAGLLASADLLADAVGAGLIDRDKVLQIARQRYGAGKVGVIQDWFRLLDASVDLPLTDRLKRVNEFWNSRVLASTDSAVWGAEDYWATPLESLGKGAGDCEDYVIGKYFSLLALGVAPEQLRFIYVRARVGGMGSNESVAHMVLGYYENPAAEPLILDNLVGLIRPAKARPDLSPVFSFNAQGVYAGGKTTSVERIGRWQNLLGRMRREGFQV